MGPPTHPDLAYMRVYLWYIKRPLKNGNPQSENFWRVFVGRCSCLLPRQPGPAHPPGLGLHKHVLVQRDIYTVCEIRATPEVRTSGVRVIPVCLCRPLHTPSTTPTRARSPTPSLSTCFPLCGVSGRACLPMDEATSLISGLSLQAFAHTFYHANPRPLTHPESVYVLSSLWCQRSRLLAHGWSYYYGCISMQRYWSSLLRYCPRDSVFVGCRSSSTYNYDAWCISAGLCSRLLPHQPAPAHPLRLGTRLAPPLLITSQCVCARVLVIYTPCVKKGLPPK